jgi:hypothetical protein
VTDDAEIVRDEEIRQLETFCNCSSRLIICAWIETSSADTGSSATISFGRSASARATPDPLALAAGELVRKAVVVLRRRPTISSSPERAGDVRSCSQYGGSSSGRR